MHYVGRFAPSPTGPLHFGSLVTAVASYCDARAHAGQWLLRIENVDTTREVLGASKQIIDSLKSHGFEWDSNIVYQDQRTEFYEKYFNLLKKKSLIYPCSCTRKEIADSTSESGIEGLIYPRTCYPNEANTKQKMAWRMHVANQYIHFVDRVAGAHTHHMPTDIGDFIIKRADGLFAYHLAVVTDDAKQGVTHVVRGEDLLNSTSRQILLQQALNLQTPSYMHIPIVKNADGEKLSKQTSAPAISNTDVIYNLYQAFTFLNLNPPQSILNASISESWKWAFEQWRTHYIN
jgi:glutamyl-Q tRNA(Asp) synthetase